VTAGERDADFTEPVALEPAHDIGAFDCGRPELTSWLKERALRAAESETARTFVVCREAGRVVAYFSLAAGAVAHVHAETRERAPRRLRQNAPDPVPVIILGRLAVDRSEQGRGLGSALVSEAMRRAVQASSLIGARALLVHALDAPLVAYYQSLGFTPFSPASRTLYLPMKTIRDGL
jgi:GNAT superfamily N-acetyltransferase